jgi:predicted lysophospholipase L1 biosynthesis ABC-type transport system permease subunit
LRGVSAPGEGIRRAPQERKWPVRPFKIAAIAIGVVLAYLIVSTVIGFFIWAVLAALVAAAIYLAVKAGFRRRRVSRSRTDADPQQLAYDRLRDRPQAPGVDDELARLRAQLNDRR